MRIFRSLEEVPADFGPAIVSVGNFDGVHCGHQHVLHEVVRRARANGSKAIAVTFEPHPFRILRPDVVPRLITPLPKKEALLAQTGLDALLEIPFTRDFSMTTAHDFASNILAGKLRAKEVHEGDNFRFGHNAEGNTEKLKELGRELGFKVEVCPVMMVRGIPVSSSQVRALLTAGKVSMARRLLGRVFSITGAPGRGRGYGHKYTVPTINLSRYDDLIPGNGVYLTQTRVGNETFNSVTNVGLRPTFGDESFAIETHLLDFHPIDVTAQTEVEISFLRWRRAEIKFPSIDALKEQIGKDVRRAQRYFGLLRFFTPRTSSFQSPER
ncbi:MAG TPA: bifunctional riboflavin kinase/FAD synthetase [Candidatus Angelobacter sp.]|jgi:riboflavin kinase / FMN adenylyltransferase|nr:bifunctional riboflavin kinase/FAD synthetase [Candidatus Angelobacter sp.]